MKTLFKNCKIVNVFINKIIDADILIDNNIIIGVDKYEDINADKIIDLSGKIVCPSFIDGHIHIESSMLTPKEFARVSIVHGTSAIVADPHEIANVCGIDGVKFMLQASQNLPMDFYFMLPSCVPATQFDESGATLSVKELSDLYNNQRVLGLAEMMNYVGVVQGNKEILSKINYAYNNNKIINGHAPLLKGINLDKYIAAHITDDHECSNIEEAIEKLGKGQYIMIREGSSAKNLEALIGLFQQPYCNRAMLVTDDKHPADLVNIGHIDSIIKKAINLGADPIIAIKMGSFNVANYFKIKDCGAIAPGYVANFLVLNDINSIDISSVYYNGVEICQNGKLIDEIDNPKIDKNIYKKVYGSCNIRELKPNDLIINPRNKKCRVIQVLPGQLLTNEIIKEIDFNNDNGIDKINDILKIAVVERHNNTGHIGLGFVQGFGLQKGAIASTVSHDSHNLIIIGTNESDMAVAGNALINCNGGCVLVVDGQIKAIQELPIAGLMSDKSASEVANENENLLRTTNEIGVASGINPFMLMAFISLSVIPSLKITTLGLVDVNKQELVDLFVD